MILTVKEMSSTKRILDVVGALTALIIFGPIMVITAIIIKLTSEGPIFFIQKRVGRGGEPFNLFKFRTMVFNAEDLKMWLLKRNEQAGPIFKIRNDPRVTRVGRFLRKTSLDELPQLINVLKGEMSLVGPRPPTVEEVRQYEPWHYQRLMVTPGLTCTWQTSGRSNIGFNDWVRMDIEYIKSSSVLTDLKLILKTFPVMITGKGAY